jgi:hypothetical protein
MIDKEYPLVCSGIMPIDNAMKRAWFILIKNKI